MRRLYYGHTYVCRGCQRETRAFEYDLLRESCPMCLKMIPRLREYFAGWLRIARSW